MRVSAAIAISSCALFFAGCGGMPVATTSRTGSVPRASISGRVHGGQSPIVGARVYLLAVNVSGTSTYGGPGIPASATNKSQSVLTSGDGQDSLGYYVTTDANGNFNITGDYTCPSSYAHPYLYAAGGFPGGGTSNSAIVLTAPVGSCGGSSEFIVINEVSTVVTAYVFAGFASDPTHTSASNSALAATNLDNAANTVSNIEDPMTGSALATTPAGNGAIPQAEINTLANILAACVNSVGPTSTQCSTLFGNAMNGATPAPDTATAALNIAHNPGANITTLYPLQSSTSPFQPMLNSAPNDFTIAINYTGGGLDDPRGIAVDASGNVWTANYSGDSVSAFSPTGVAISPGTTGFQGGGLDDPIGMAIDANGHAWVANYGGSSISEFNTSGEAVLGSPFTGGGLDDPFGIAIDSSGNVWEANYTGNSVSEFSSSGGAISPATTGYNGAGLNQPTEIAIDTGGNAWVASNGNSSVRELGPSGSPGADYSGSGLSAPFGVALDASADIWLTSDGNSTMSEYSSSGLALSGVFGDRNGGLDLPRGIAIDSGGNAWAANYGVSSISKFNSSGSAVTSTSGYKGGLNQPEGIAIDGAGNVWVGNYAGETLTEFVGAAAPVVTPIVANLLPPYGSSAVNLP
jgi:sugar lactone lactonase YvrE